MTATSCPPAVSSSSSSRRTAPFGDAGPACGGPVHPRDLIALNAETPISNVRLNPASDDAFSGIEGVAIAGQFGSANPDAARDALGGQPLTVRVGYQAPNPRLAATVGAITKSCAAAGITVVDTTSATTGPQTLRDGKLDVLLASTGGATGSGSTGSSALDAYTLFSGDGNNLPRYVNPQIDGIISALAVTADAKEQARLLGDSSPILWGDMPTSRCTVSSARYWHPRRCMRWKAIRPSGARAGIWTDGCTRSE